ncbi:DUF2335 domain-containing protein [Rhizobium rhizogenes]|uniref:DUF2335 domain-containing protein n=1 Tax=Rhizobium rhizogenes TaxID=359 RepID=UPI00157440C2|nr:DUF2335 domain-containing protein [Rhizobium rhizogenes]NTI22062.1 DUF2335 domain-containing protein [Rhizobium rhizogenes]QTG05663.1 DUF2335 domain-containing protein [Rhizobium rhizogenes]
MVKNVTKSGVQTSKPPEKPSDTIEGEVEQRLEPVLSNLSRVQRAQIISTVVNVVETESFSGPLPHPRHLEYYDNVLPGGAERILQMAEKTLQHNLDVKSRGQRYDHNYRLIGMGLGFSALILLIGAAVYVGLQDKPVVSTLLLGTTVVGSIGMFITAHHKK